VDRLCRAPVKIVLEGDGRRWHTRVQDFPRDARRRRDAARAGYLTINYLYEELRDDPDGVEAEILEILGFGGDVPRKR
jgi:very-short-patch-repair endonuclease